MVLFKIELENKKGKYHFCLDRDDYSLYPSENEVLLQAGMKAFVKKVEKETTFQGDWTVFHLYISDNCVEIQSRKRTLLIMIPYSLFIL